MTSSSDQFRFLDPGRLIDGDMELVLVRCHPADPVKQWVPWYDFEIRVPDRGGPVAGTINFRAGTTRALEMCGGHIAYRVEPEHRGHHYAARSVRLLLPFARAHGLTTIWITCNPDNWASRGTCELAGATFVEIVPLPANSDMYAAGEREKCRYRIDL